jgi:heme-degrading monooxygenase HmoA
MNADFRVLLKVRVVPGLEAEFEREWLAGDEVVAGHPANRGHWLARSDQEENTYYVISDWSDEPSFREFERSDTHVEHRQRMFPYRVGGEMATMRIVAGSARAQEPVS